MNGMELWLATEWASRLSQVLESMTGQESPCSAAEGAEAGSEPDWWRQEFDAAPGAAVWVGAAEKDWTETGGTALRAAGIEDAGPADIRSTFLEAVSQALSATAQTLGSRLGREVNCGPLNEADPPDERLPRFTVTVTLPDIPAASVLLCFGAELLAALQPPREQAPPPAAVADPAPARTMELLLDVELPVSVSFGRAQLPLKDVLKLTTGSIVELNRSVVEPVEIIVNNCVIARGEVVVLEGNYGVRIHQIISRQERLRTLY